MVTEGLNRIQASGSDPASGCGPTFEKRRAEKASPAPSKGASVKGSSGAGAPVPPGDEDPEKHSREFKKRDFKKGDQVDLKRFTQRQSQSGQRARQVDPKTGDYLEHDFAANSGREHGGSHWKLYSSRGEPLGAFTRSGQYLRPITKFKG